MGQVKGLSSFNNEPDYYIRWYQNRQREIRLIRTITWGEGNESVGTIRGQVWF
jgi:hypothetical protein